MFEANKDVYEEDMEEVKACWSNEFLKDRE